MNEITEDFETEFVKCHGCQHVFKSLWPIDPLSPNRPQCPKCGSKETYPTADATPFEHAETN